MPKDDYFEPEEFGGRIEFPDEEETSRETDGPDEIGVYGKDIVNVRMNSNGDVMDSEYAVGVIRPQGEDKHPAPEVLSPFVSDRSGVTEALTRLRASVESIEKQGGKYLVMVRFVTQPKVEIE